MEFPFSPPPFSFHFFCGLFHRRQIAYLDLEQFHSAGRRYIVMILHFSLVFANTHRKKMEFFLPLFSQLLRLNSRRGGRGMKTKGKDFFSEVDPPPPPPLSEFVILAFPPLLPKCTFCAKMMYATKKGGKRNNPAVVPKVSGSFQSRLRLCRLTQHDTAGYREEGRRECISSSSTGDGFCCARSSSSSSSSNTGKGD